MNIGMLQIVSRAVGVAMCTVIAIAVREDATALYLWIIAGLLSMVSLVLEVVVYELENKNESG